MEKIITIDPISIATLVLIIVTFVYSFFKYRSGYKKEPVLTEKISTHTETEGNLQELPVITAIISILMEQKPFKLKNIVIGKGEEISMWRQSGRQEIMRRRANMQR